MYILENDLKLKKYEFHQRKYLPYELKIYLTRRRIHEWYEYWNGDERGKFGKLPDKWKFLLSAPFNCSEKCCDIMKKKPFKKYNINIIRPDVMYMMVLQ